MTSYIYYKAIIAEKEAVEEFYPYTLTPVIYLPKLKDLPISSSLWNVYQYFLG